MTTLRVLWSDHLSADITSLKHCDKDADIVFFCETRSEATYVKHHKKKLVFLWAAMRHFANDLRDQGYTVHYTKIDDGDNTHSVTDEVRRMIKTHDISKIVVTHPGEHRILDYVQTWSDQFCVDVDILNDDRFLCSVDGFSAWAESRKQLRMEYFYRDMRKKYDILMDNGDPIGGQWNFDAENRKPPKNGLNVPKPYNAEIDDITQNVMDVVENLFPDHFGDIEPFHFGVTRDQAQHALQHFIDHRLDNFGTYQDAMIQNEPWMFHSHISFYMNCGLLSPMECVRAAENAYKNDNAPLNAVEGFIRQIIGWREYVRGIYWLNMPEYAHKNFFHAQRELPEFYWNGNTKMNCLRQCVLETKQNAYAHHIQRLMVLGNFALIAGIDPKYVNEWFLIVYADAFEWVELPNVTGMILFADGGYLASKPYAAGGSYINKMSNYCKNCSYKVTQKNGKDACPFNYLYWDFLDRNREKLQSNHRIGMMYKTYDRMDDDKKTAIKEDSARFFKNIQNGEIV